MANGQTAEARALVERVETQRSLVVDDLREHADRAWRMAKSARLFVRHSGKGPGSEWPLRIVSDSDGGIVGVHRDARLVHDFLKERRKLLCARDRFGHANRGVRDL